MISFHTQPVSFCSTALQKLSTLIFPPQPQNNISFKFCKSSIKATGTFSPRFKSPICIHFNENVCAFPNSKFMHVSSWLGYSLLHSVSQEVLSCKISEINMNHPWTPVNVLALPKLYRIMTMLCQLLIRSRLVPKNNLCP